MARLGDGYGGRLALEVMLGMHDGTNRLQLDGSVIDLQLADLPAASLIGGMFTGANRLRADLLNHAGVTEITHFTLAGPRLDLSVGGHYSAEAPLVAITLDRLDMAALYAAGRGALTGAAVMSGENGTVQYGLTLQGAAPLATGIGAVDALIDAGLTLEARATATPDGAVSIDTARIDARALRAQFSGQQAADGTARFVAEALLEDIGRLVPGIRGEATLQGSVTRAVGATGYGVDAALRGPSGLTATARGLVNDDFTLALDLAGQVESVLFNPSIEPASVQGLIRFEGGLNGPAALDALRLSARLDGGRYVLPGAGIAFRDIGATAQVNGLIARVAVLGESATGGRAALEGTIRLDDQREADLQVHANGLVVQMPQLFDARLTGDVHLTGPLSAGAVVSGAVTVDQAEIHIPNSPLGRQGVAMPGLTHVGEDAASHQTRVNAGIASGTRLGRQPVPLGLDLTLTAPGRVYVRGRGLDAELGGSLQLGGTTRDVVPAGSFTLIRGRLDLLGNRFNLTDGSASMIGSFMPFVRLTATTDSDGVQTSVTLAGQADAPEITFSSVPELPQDEVLARLVFGRSLTSLSPFQAAQLALSVATLTGRAENSILSRTRAAMGLDDLDFTVDPEGNTRLRAGRHIGDRVYTDISVDNTGQGEVTINLDLTPSIRLRGRADSDGGSGLGIYFERDY